MSPFERMIQSVTSFFTPAVEKAETTPETQPDPQGFAFDDYRLLGSPGQKSGLIKPTRISYQVLRIMSRSNPIIRLCIDTLKHQVARADWDIVPNDEDDDDEALEPYIDRVKALLKRPNGNNETFRTLIEKTVEDLLVMDQADWEIVRNAKGEIAEIYALDGATIRPVFDKHGQYLNPAYLQYLPNSGGKVDITKPDAQFSLGDVVHMMQNPQTDMRLFGYGFSPIESIIATATNYLQADMYQSNMFTDGTFSDKILNLGKDIDTGKVKAFREYWKAEIQGRSHALPIIGGTEDPSVIDLGPSPKDAQFMEYLQWLARLIVGAFGLSPQDIGLNLDQYKAEGQVQADLSHRKGYMSLLDILAEYINQEIIWQGMGELDEGYKNIKFQWIGIKQVDEKKRAEVAKIEVGTGLKTLNEYRRELGLEEYEGFGDRPFILTGTGPVYLDETPLLGEGVTTQTAETEGEDDEEMPTMMDGKPTLEEEKEKSGDVGTDVKTFAAPETPTVITPTEQRTLKAAVDHNNPTGDDDDPGLFSFMDDDRLKHPFGGEYAYLAVGERVTRSQYAQAQRVYKKAAQMAHQFAQPVQIQAEINGLRNVELTRNYKEAVNRINEMVKSDAHAILGIVNHFQQIGHTMEPVYGTYRYEFRKVAANTEGYDIQKAQQTFSLQNGQLEQLIDDTTKFFHRRIKAMLPELTALVPTMTKKAANDILAQNASTVSDDEVDEKLEDEDRSLLAKAAEIGLGIGLLSLLRNAPAERQETIADRAKSVTVGDMQSILEERALQMAKSVKKTMKDGARRLIARLVNEGKSTEDITKALQQFLGVNDPWRARRIARTEVSWAANRASQEQAGAAGATMKRWRTVGGGELLEACRQNEAQDWIPVTKEFQSGHMTAPNHPNCLCHVEYDYKEI